MMAKLIELLEITNENTNVLVKDTNCNDLTMYDGKNNINEIFNDCEVIDIQMSDNWLVVIVKNDIEIIYDFNIDKYYTFNQLKEYCENSMQEKLSNEEINDFIFVNLFENGGSFQIVSLSDIIEDANDGMITAKKFLLNL